MTVPSPRDPLIDERPVQVAGAWLKPLRSWPGAAVQLLATEGAVVRVVVAQARGSVPRDAGICMLVGAKRLLGTIGGGQLEWQAVAAARELLGRGGEAASLEHFTLATDLGQCCGGVVDVWMECYTAASQAMLGRAQAASERGAAIWRSALAGSTIEHEVVVETSQRPEAARLLAIERSAAFPQLSVEPDGRVTLLERLDEVLPALWIYGAGHVGQALARIAADLPVRLTWIDPRQELLPRPLPGEVSVLQVADPAGTVPSAPAGTYFVVLTHSHTLDYQLCREILRRADQAWVGVIGSRSKAAKFRARLLREGFAAEAVAQLVCPMGLPNIKSKWPSVIAVSVATQLLQAMHAPDAATASGGKNTDCARSECATCQPVNRMPA
jgi:xanthine dehydrogenase accessory factor